MLQESKFAAEGSDAAAAGAHAASAQPVGERLRSAVTSAPAATATAGDAPWRQGIASPAPGGFDRRGAARYSLSRALQAGAACSPAKADDAAWRLEAALHGKCPATNCTYEQRYFKLASELRADASMCNSVLSGDELSAEVAVVLLEVSYTQAPALPDASAHISGGGGAPPAATGSPHHPTAGLAPPPEPDSVEGREATPRRGCGAQWSGASTATADVAAHASRDLRCLTEQLAGLHAASGVEIALNNPTLLHLRRDPEILIAALRDALAPGGAAPTWRSEIEALRALVPMCRMRSQAARAQEAQLRATHPPVPLEPLAAPLPAWRPPASQRALPPPHADDGAVELPKSLHHAKDTAKTAGRELAPRSLFVSRVPKDAQPAEVAALFAKFGAVDFVVFPPKYRSTSHKLRCCSVTMADKSLVQKVLNCRFPQQDLLLRPGMPPVCVEQSWNALVPTSHERGDWIESKWVAQRCAAQFVSGVVEVERQQSPAERDRSCEPRHRSSPRWRSERRTLSPPRHRCSRSRSRSPGRHGHRRAAGNSDSLAHAITPAARAKSYTAPKQPLLTQTLPPALPPPPLNPPMAANAAFIPSILTCSFLVRPGQAAGHPIAVVGMPLAGACALPLPLSLELQWPVSQVEQLGARLSRERLSVVALAGGDAAAAEALRQLAAQLATPAMVPGGQMQAAGMLATDGAAHFFMPLLCESALSLIRATAQPGAPPPPPHAAGVVVSLLLSDVAVTASWPAERHSSHAAARV